MSTNRSRRIDREAAEHLLAGTGADPEAGRAAVTGHPALAGLLAAAAAPAAEAEQTGEQAALAAFRQARLSPTGPTASTSPTAQPRRRTMADTALARAFSAKALAAAFAATALGGVAVAAGTGTLPAGLGGGPQPGQRASAVPAAPTGAGASAARTSDRSPGPGATTASARPGGPAAAPGAGPAGSSAPGARPSGSPTADASAAGPALAPLCRTFGDRLRSGEHLVDLMRERSFQPLFRAAGTTGRAADYCAGLLRDDQPGTDPSPGRDGRRTTPSPRTDRPTTAAPSPSGGRRG
ncbi:hypothetical protein AB0K43_20880 [Kitasatospora sp. NPDC049258]|uniref:hypothetical protein n=1 Tax=Kitasatospora sp. NPDC049258 TaxID=3155394 RepID=UPI00343CF7C5